MPPAVLGALSFLLLRDNDSAVRGIAGFGLAVLAAPGLLVAGVPLRSGAGVYLAAAVGSAVLWFVVGVVAAHRATANPTATWRHFWREYALLMLAAWIGVGVALMMANLLLGRLLF
jgi:hypothetical protein